MWPVLVLQFHFEVFIFKAIGDGREFHQLYTHFWVNLDILPCILKLWIKAFRTYLYILNVASICPTISVRIFEFWCRRRGWVSFIHFTSISGSIWPFLHASWSYSQCWSCHFILDFWCFMQLCPKICIPSLSSFTYLESTNFYE